MADSDPPNDIPEESIDSSLTSEAIQKINVADEIKNSFLDYSMSVIVSRALPDARDGLKPSQRRILLPSCRCASRLRTWYSAPGSVKRWLRQSRLGSSQRIGQALLILFASQRAL